MSKSMPLWKNVVFHLLPGAVIAAIYLLLSTIIKNELIPKILILYISGLFLLPIMYYIMKAYSPDGKIIKAVQYRNKLPFFKVLLFGVVAFLWAAFIGVVFNKLEIYIQINLFGWMADSFDYTGYFVNPDSYPKYMLILTWAVGLVTTSTLLPVVEEIYFRGFLLSKLEKYKFAAVLISALLFSMYHMISPWQIVTRFIAIIPMTYFIYKYKNISIGIVAHVLLNLIGDTILRIPIIFG
ncbi:MAG: CPBP family intramembrane metalloprotease [Clostridiales bacterium]|nr:CPBP family intramembrane metalloprotease [Clostridiales bacterium]